MARWCGRERPLPFHELEHRFHGCRESGAQHLHHASAFDLALRFACEIFRKSSGAFWPKHNLISTRSNHTRETLTATPAKDAAPFIVSQLTQDIELS
jgi:hypothetical protein